MDRLINIHGKNDKFAYKDSFLIVSATSCWQANEAILGAIENLSLKGTREDYLSELKQLGCANPEETLNRLCEKGVLKKPSSFTRSIWNFLKDPKIRLIKGSWFALLFKKEWLDKIFQPWIMVFTFVIYALILFWLYFAPFLFGLPKFQPAWNKVSLVFILIGALFHETGHSIACAHNGVGFRPIGISWYLIWPIAFTNVSGMELLNKRQKFIVNAGGIYIQIWAIVILFFLDRVFPNAGCGAAIQILNYLILFNLNPFIRSDGYWCIQDSLSSSEEKPKKRGTLDYIYQIGFGIFTAYLVYKVGKSTYKLIITQYSNAQNFNMIGLGQMLSAIMLIYLQLLILKGISSRILFFLDFKKRAVRTS